MCVSQRLWLPERHRRLQCSMLMAASDLLGYALLRQRRRQRHVYLLCSKWCTRGWRYLWPLTVGLLREVPGTLLVGDNLVNQVQRGSLWPACQSQGLAKSGTV